MPRPRRDEGSVTESVSEPPPSPSPTSSEDDAARFEALGARLSVLEAELRRRGILRSDLGDSPRRALRDVRDHIDGRRHAEAERALASLDRELRQVRIDEDFVRRKLDRVDARIQLARSRGVETSRVEDLVAAALRDFMDGRYEIANRRLNQILRQLDR